MTVVTKPIAPVHKDQSKQTLLKPDSVSVSVIDASSQERRCGRAGGGSNAGGGFPARPSCLGNTCYFLALVLALVIGFVGAVQIFKMLRGPRYHRGFCEIPYGKLLENSLNNGDFRGVDGPSRLDAIVEGELVGDGATSLKNRGLELDYELDLDLEEFEELMMPELSSGRYLHDFKVNKTAIIDPKNDRCFVMPLDRSEVPRPKTFLDILRDLRDGVYELNLEEIRHDTRIVLPPIGQVRGQFGPYIQSACEDKTTFDLEPVKIFKREIGGPSQFTEFTGTKWVRYNLVNLDQI